MKLDRINVNWFKMVELSLNFNFDQFLYFLKLSFNLNPCYDQDQIINQLSYFRSLYLNSILKVSKLVLLFASNQSNILNHIALLSFQNFF